MSYTNTKPLTDERRAQLAADCESHRRKMEPASTEELTKAIAKLSMGCKHGNNEALDRKAFIAILMEHAAGYPIDIIREACYEWTHANTFFPSIAEFCALCEPKFQKRRAAYDLMRQGLAASDRKRAEAQAEAERLRDWNDPAKRKELERKAAEVRASLKTETVVRRITPRRVDLPEAERERLLSKLTRKAG